MLITEKELCKILKVDRSFLYSCRSQGLPFKRLGTKIIRYDLSKVLEWFDKYVVTEEVNCIEKE